MFVLNAKLVSILALIFAVIYALLRSQVGRLRLIWDNSNPRVGADHGVDFDWSRLSHDCPDVSAKI